MDKQYKIEQWIKSKGIKIIEIANGSHFDHDTPDTIFIDKHSGHGISASILHEYYHARQYKRHKPRLNRANIEYRAELFVIRCFKQLGIEYNTTFIEQCWRDRPEYLLDDSGYYTLAYGLLVKNGLLNIDYKE